MLQEIYRKIQIVYTADLYNTGSHIRDAKLWSTEMSDLCIQNIHL